MIFFALGSSVYSQTAEDYTRKGVEFADKKQYDHALEMFKKAVSLQDRNSARTFHNRGWLMEIQGNIPAAMENYREAVRRNPALSDSFERMGFLSYKAGKYSDAVLMGEKVLAVEPSNQEVKKWLPDAYKLKMEHPEAPASPEILKQTPLLAEDLKKKQEEKTALADAKKEEKKEEPPAKMGVFFDTTFLPGYKYNSGSLCYSWREGVLVDMPFTAGFWFKPIPNSDTRFSFSAGNPYLGAGIPQTVNQMEKTEAVFSVGPFGIGGGFCLSHYYNDINYGGKRALTDFKVGGIVEFKNEESAFTLSAYPRGIPYLYTTDTSTGKTMDVCTAELKYTYFLDETLSYYSRMQMNDYYFFDNTAKISNYWGFYDIVIGLTLGSKGAIMGKDLSTTVEVGKRVYLQSLNNKDPYSWFNGQGYLGVNTKSGSYFSGFHGTSNLFSFRAEESINTYLFIYQKLTIEFVDKNVDHNEFAFQLGVGGKF